MHHQNNAPDSVETCLHDIRAILPAVDALLAQYETMKLQDYITQLSQLNIDGFQCHKDFIAEVADYTRIALGSEIGDAIYDDLLEMPQVLTANHHGIDTFAQSTQSNLLFSMRKKADGNPLKTIPVLACGSIPMNNLTYPRGLLIYASSAALRDGGICKLPLFPDSYKRKLVSVAEPFTAEMLQRSRTRSKKLIADNKLTRPLESALHQVFDDFSRVGHEFTSYSGQATVANHRIWKRLFRDRSCRSELVYVEMESIVRRLLKIDLFDRSTICHQLLFDPELRARLIESLDGERGCWRYDKLLRDCSASLAMEDHNSTNVARGTMFFWGVDSRGRKIPLCVSNDKNQAGIDLRGIDDTGQLWVFPFTPTGIAQGLQDGHLLPSIFTSYLLISIARGISCIGGYYQADYLPVMKKAVINTLRSNSAESVKTTNLETPRSDLYLSGMQTIGLQAHGQLLPAGPLEIIASGGLDAKRYQQIGEVTILQSHIASLYDIIMDVAPQGGQAYLAKKEIATLVNEKIGSKIVTISTDLSPR
ncbi:MAG: hypothetical protein GY820_29520 [Gammaproteobacteria bacterium]|nr:hypothetical protein [Gammaproteobacteria bacterium]